MGGAAKEITDHAELKKHVNENKKVILDFTAVWCGPCQTIGPVFVELAEQHSDISFVKVDVDEGGEIAEAYDVSCMPTFVCLHDGQAVEDLKLEGADPDTLKDLVEKFKKL